MDGNTWVWLAVAVTSFTSVVFAVLMWEYKRRIVEMELDRRLDAIEQLAYDKSKRVERELHDSQRSLWEALDSINTRLDCCNKSNCKVR
jgi:heme exporter protein D